MDSLPVCKCYQVFRLLEFFEQGRPGSLGSNGEGLSSSRALREVSPILGHLYRFKSVGDCLAQAEE